MLIEKHDMAINKGGNFYPLYLHVGLCIISNGQISKTKIKSNNRSNRLRACLVEGLGL